MDMRSVVRVSIDPNGQDEYSDKALRGHLSHIGLAAAHADLGAVTRVTWYLQQHTGPWIGEVSYGAVLRRARSRSRSVP